MLAFGCDSKSQLETVQYRIEKIPKGQSIGAGLDYKGAETSSRYVNNFYSVGDIAGQPAVFDLKLSKDLAQVVKYMPFSSATPIQLEGVVMAEDGTLWLADALTPSIINFDPQTKKILNSISIAQGLPEILKNARQDRGFSAIEFAAGRVFIFLESSLDFGEKGKAATFIRLFVYDPVRNSTKTFAYTIDENLKSKRSEVRILDMTHIEAERFLILEKAPSGEQAIVEIDLGDASNITGKLVNDDELEAVSDRRILFGDRVKNSSGLIKPINKRTFLRLANIGWNSGDVEGLALLPDGKTLAISESGSSKAKIWLVTLPKSIYPAKDYLTWAVTLFILAVLAWRVRR
jgi:hypothetical protein